MATNESSFDSYDDGKLFHNIEPYPHFQVSKYTRSGTILQILTVFSFLVAKAGR